MKFLILVFCVIAIFTNSILQSNTPSSQDFKSELVIVGDCAQQNIPKSLVHGRIIDKETGKGIPGKYVKTNVKDQEGYFSSKTDSKGYFLINIPFEKDFEYELVTVFDYDPKTYQTSGYYLQRIKKEFRVEEGRDLFLDPIEVARGIMLKGTIKLWNDTIVPKGKLMVVYTNKETDEEFAWNAFLNSSGNFHSEPVPLNHKLEIYAEELRSEDETIGYGRIIKTVLIESVQTNRDIKIIIPQINTRIEGKVFDKNGKPLSDQVIRLDTFNHLGKCKTDKNGFFQANHLIPGKVGFYVENYINGLWNKSYNAKKDLQLKDNESLLLKVILNEDSLNIDISKTPLKKSR